MKRKIFTSLMLIALAAALVGGSTFAYFSDSETSSGNTFAAGTLNLGLANISDGTQTGSATTTWSSPEAWAPGQTAEGTLYINNEGTINANSVTVDFDYTITEGTPATVDAGNTILDNMIKITDAKWANADVTALEGKTLAELKALNPALLGSLAANTESPLFIQWTFDGAADNGCQGDSATVTLTLTATQN